MFVVSLGSTLEENKALSLMKVPQLCDFKRLMGAATQILGCDQKSPNYELNSPKEVNNQIDNHSQCSVPPPPPKISSLWALGLV